MKCVTVPCSLSSQVICWAFPVLENCIAWKKSSKTAQRSVQSCTGPEILDNGGFQHGKALKSSTLAAGDTGELYRKADAFLVLKTEQWGCLEWPNDGKWVVESALSCHKAPQPTFLAHATGTVPSQPVSCLQRVGLPRCLQYQVV